MKSKITILIVAITLFSCSESNQKKAEKAVANHLKTVLNDPASYQPVSFDTLKIDSSSVLDSKDYVIAKANFNAYSELFKKNSSESKYETDYEMLKVYSDYMKKYSDSMNYYSNKMQVANSLFKPMPIGYLIYHKYRGKNKMGALILAEDFFYLDSTFKVITKPNEN